jgi:sigma-B regulation protein RsbU (phosphoserine phosphatase)
VAPVTEKPEFVQLDEKLFELQALFDLSKALNSSLNLKNILDTILLTPMGKMLIGKGVVLISNGGKGYEIDTLKGLPKSLLGQTIEIDDLPTQPQYLAQLAPTPWQAFFLKNGIELIIPIVHDQKKLGLIGFGKKILGKDYSDSELDYLHSLSNIAATAVQNGLIFQELKEVNRQLDKKVQELNTLFEIGKELNSTLETDKVVNLLAYSIMGEMMVNRCLIFLKIGDSMTLKLNKGYQSEQDLHITTEAEFLNELLALEAPLILSESEHPLTAKFKKLAIAIVVPMRIQNETKGVIALGDKITRNKFVKEELDFLTTLGNLSVISIENARLFEETLEKQRMEEELLIARDIQKRLLPDSCLTIPNYDVASINIPSRQVGGDYFDCIKLNDGQYAFCIADVSGKGVPAALLMSNLQASLHALLNTGLTIDEICFRINNIIYRNTSIDKFITFFGAILDTQTRTLTSVNAGHNPPYLFHKDGSFETLTEGGLLLGMMPNMPYTVQTVQLQSGDGVLMFTDGVSEAVNIDEEEFEEKRIEACIQKNYSKPAAEILQIIIKEVKEFSQGLPQADDITMLVLKVL